MGYYDNGVFANYTWYAERGNASEISTDNNCTIPTRCQNNLEKKQQICKGNNELLLFHIHTISKEGNLTDLLTLRRLKLSWDQWQLIFGYLKVLKRYVSLYTLRRL